eukprot:scaffold17891_cov113-Isochrysis_galbana.AAC.1
MLCALPRAACCVGAGHDCEIVPPSAIAQSMRHLQAAALQAGSCQVCRSMKGEGDRGLGRGDRGVRVLREAPV